MSVLMVKQLKTVYSVEDVQVTHTQLDVGQEIPWHKHTSVTDTFYAICGPVIVELDFDRKIMLSTGESAQVPAGQAHRVFNPGETMVEFLLIQGVGVYDFLDVRSSRTP